MPRFTDRRRDVFVEALRDGAWRTSAAQAAGVHFSTVRRHMITDAAFADEVEEAELDANTAVENALYERALGGNITACLAWLYSRMPDRWRDMRHTAGPSIQPVPPAKELTADQRKTLLEAVDEVRSVESG
jgi:hypothetical protein